MALSFSQLSTYRRCPKQYEFASVKKNPRRMSSGESFGSSMHNALRRFGELELQHQRKDMVKNQLTLFSDEHDARLHRKPLTLTTLLEFFRECFIAEGYESRTATDAALLRGEKILEAFFAWWSQEKREIVTIESGFKLEIPSASGAPILVSGRYDRIERTPNGLRILDYKTSEPRSQEHVDEDLQLSIYALAAAKQWREPIERISLLFLGDEIIERTTARNTADLERAKDEIRTLATGIGTGHFEATPSMEKCRHCPYREICRSRAA